MKRHTWLVSSAGRRGALINLLKSTSLNGMSSRVLAIDNSKLSAAGYLADKLIHVPRVDDETFISSVKEISRNHDVDIIIPTIDPELQAYSVANSEFKEMGTDVWVSAPEVVELGWDKWNLFKWLGMKGFPTPDTFEIMDPAALTHTGPVVAKPRSGSSSIGVLNKQSVSECLDLQLTSDYIIQEQMTGEEITVDFAVDKFGRYLGAVQRKRLEVRGGEVSKGVTIKSEVISQIVHDLANSLPGPYGVLNVQLFFDEATNEASILEINPRFGGGYPLTHAAGADFAGSLLRSNRGEFVPIDYKENVAMLRFDDAVFIDLKTGGRIGK